MIVCLQLVVASSFVELEKASEHSKTKIEHPIIKYGIDSSSDKMNRRNSRPRDGGNARSAGPRSRCLRRGRFGLLLVCFFYLISFVPLMILLVLSSNLASWSVTLVGETP